MHGPTGRGTPPLLCVKFARGEIAPRGKEVRHRGGFGIATTGRLPLGCVCQHRVQTDIQDHFAFRAPSWAVKPASSSRQRRSSTTRPASMRPITGIGRSRKRARQRLDRARRTAPQRPQRQAGARQQRHRQGAAADLALGLDQRDLGDTVEARSTAGSSRCAKRRDLGVGRASSRSAGSRSASRSGSA